MTVDDTELNEMGLQTRPTEATALQTWTASMWGYRGVDPVQYCTGGHAPSAIKTTSAAAAADTKNVSASTAGEATINAHKGSGNWVGYEYRNSGGYIGAVGHWTQNGAAACGCSSSRESTWVGIGGDPGGLIQAGTTDNGNTGNLAWGEWVTVCGSIGELDRSGVGVGVDTAAAVTWNPATGKGTMQVAQGGVLKANINYTAPFGSSCINNQVAEFMDERPSTSNGTYPLTNFVTTNFGNARVVTGTPANPVTTGISHLTATAGTAVVMTNDGSAGSGSCAPGIIAWPGNNALSDGFAIHWCRIG